MTGVEAIKRYAQRKKEEFEASGVNLPLATGEAMALAYNDVLVFIREMERAKKERKNDENMGTL